MSIIDKRFQFRGRTFAPMGRATSIGAARASGLGAVEEYGPARTITLLVGLNKGKQPKNRADRCRRAPSKFDVAAIDRKFVSLRAAQIGRKAVAGTRQVGRGWYEGDREASVAFEVAFIPGGIEKTFTTFRANMNRLAEAIAEDFCQDSVLIVRDDGQKRTVASATWEKDQPKRKRR